MCVAGMFVVVGIFVIVGTLVVVVVFASDWRWFDCVVIM